MADYSTIKGFTIQTIAGDPANPLEGQVWYNSTSTTLKGYAPSLPAGAWASGGALTSATMFTQGAGTQTAALAMSGTSAPPPTLNIMETTQEYNGSAWTAGGDMTTGRMNAAGAGTQTSALIAGGSAIPGNLASTEEYDGSSWSAGGDLSRGPARALQMSSGATQNAAWVAGGKNEPGEVRTADMETYNGTAWTEVANLNTIRTDGMGNGTTAAALAFGGNVPPPTVATEKWDGTSWTSVNDMNTARRDAGGSGTVTAGLCFGGTGPPTTWQAITESYDGTSWSEQADLATGRQGGAASRTGGTTASLYAGGNVGAFPSPASDATEEWTIGSAIKTFTSS